MRISASLILLVVISSFSLNPEWFTYENNEIKMSIKFPAQFNETISEKEKSTTYKVQVNDGKMLFLASGSIHNSSVEKDIDGLLATSLESFNTSLNGEIISSNPIKLNGVTGTYALINVGEYNSKIEYRAFLNGDKQYQIISAQLSTEYDQETADEFYKSFKILK